MNTNRIIELLTHKQDYKLADFNDVQLISRLRERNLEVWTSRNTNRYIVTKGYSSEAQLDTWLTDQIIISFLYEALPARYRNNLYFLLIINWGDDLDLSEKVLNQITEIEKNYRVCRKYVISTWADINRVPSLNNKFGENIEEVFNFDNEFKTRLLYSSGQNQIKSNITERISKLVNFYFEQYDEQHEDKLILQKQRVQSILQGETK
ncbi:ABC-three component system middle component 1 [Peribacillus simplex]|uniref:ABC-three component system middle component 1 n=1 Tax=Peribacillus simplex TaxID=1478 RepID=UPI003D2DE4FA